MRRDCFSRSQHQCKLMSSIPLLYTLFNTGRSVHSLSSIGDEQLLICWNSEKDERFCSARSAQTQTAPVFAPNLWHAVCFSAPFETQRIRKKLAKINWTKLLRKAGFELLWAASLFCLSSRHCQGPCTGDVLHAHCQIFETLALENGHLPAPNTGYIHGE